MKREELFRSAYRSHYRSVFASAQRRTAIRADAEDVAAETFVVAWRRVDRLPATEPDQLAWLYAVARRTLANHHRGRLRAARLDEVLLTVDPSTVPGAEYMTVIQTVDEPAAACTTAAINGGGSMFLILQGPAVGPIDPIALPKPSPEPSAVAPTPSSVAVEVWSTFVDEALETIGFDNPHAGYRHAGVSWGQDGSATAQATDGAGHRLFLAYEPWTSDNASADPKKLQRVLGMPNPGTVVPEGVLFIEETTYVITVKLAVPEGVISASIHVGTITSRNGELNADLLSALVRTSSPIARGLLGADPDQLVFVNYLPYPDE